VTVTKRAPSRLIGKSSSGWTSSVATERGDLRGYRVNLQHLYLHYRRRSAVGPDETFHLAGTINPKITVRAGARVSIQVINADPDTAHGLVITSGQGRFPWIPMMTSWLAFTGSALWVLGNPTVVGIHVPLARLVVFTRVVPAASAGARSRLVAAIAAR
jgi:hypothetical protein